jgi:hypothetical protein
MPKKEKKTLRTQILKKNLTDSVKRNDPYTHFSQKPHNRLTWLVVFYYFFTKRKQKKTKKSNKILPATSASCGAVVRNECRDNFSFVNMPRHH